MRMLLDSHVLLWSLADSAELKRELGGKSSIRVSTTSPITANIHQAKSQLSRLIERAIAGEEVVICKAGKPVARLIPYAPKKMPRRLGAWKGKVRMD